jgi:acyl-CoA synthetase (AMP-forming)/AMP-acid ligase II/acyl carrier protein
VRPAFALGEAAAAPPYPSLARAILGGIEAFPDGRFLYFGADGQTQECSFEDTLGRALGLLAGLEARGMRAGDPLLLALNDARRMVPSLWAAVLGGFVAVPFLPSARPGASAAPDARDIEAMRGILNGLRVLSDRSEGIEADGTVLDFDALSSTAHPRHAMPVPGNSEDLRFAIMTSGTTACPRLVGLSDSAALARWWPQLPDAAHSRGFLSWSSFAHVMGLGLAMPNLAVKAHLDAARFIAAPLSWLDALQASGATHATMTNFGMSLVLQAAAENPERQWRLDHVRKIGIGAEAISRQTCERFLQCLGKSGLREDALILGYGLSECGPVVGGSTPFSAHAPNDADAPPELDRPTKGHAVRIVGDTGYLLREGEIGRIEVRGPTMTSGYLGDDEAADALFTPDRWLRTGDLGVLRDGRLTVTGREKELVVVNAKKYTCQAIEAAILEHTGYREVYVAPFESDAPVSAGAPCAAFVVDDGSGALEPAVVAEAVRAATAAAFRFAPRTVALVSRDDVPRTALGKVRRLALPTLLGDPALAARVSRPSERISSLAAASGRTAIETTISRIWRELLRIEGDIDHDADFYVLGGDSLLALRMSFLVEDALGTPVRIEQIRTRLSIAELASCLIESGTGSGTGIEIGAEATPVSTPAPQVSPASPAPGLPDWLTKRLLSFLKDWPGAPATRQGFVRRVGTARQGIPVFWCMQQAEEAAGFERTVGARFPAYAMRSGLWLLDYGTPIAAALVERYAREIAALHPAGPLVFGGTCQGFNIALALARKFVAAGRDVRLLAAADTRFAELCGGTPAPVPVALFPALGSKFNPYRYFRHPEIGLRKLAPHGLHLEVIDTVYSRIMTAPAVDHLARGLETAIAWAESPQAPDRTVTAPAPGPAAMYQRCITSPSKALELREGEHLRLAVELRNTSPVAWDPFDDSGLMLGNHWLSGAGGMVIWSDGRTPLTQRLEPDARVPMTIDIMAPHQAGRYLLEIDLVEEGICWFSDLTLAPLQIPVQVRPRGE